MDKPFRSLRTRMLLPLLAVALLASVAVAVGSYVLGDRWARDEVTVRYQAIETTLSRAAFPLNRQVISLIAELTDTELITLDTGGQVIASSIEFPRRGELPSGLISAAKTPLLTIDEQVFRYGVFDRQAAANEIKDLHDRMLTATEPALLRVVLDFTGGNRAAAAQLLGIHRGTLRERMKRYDAE